MGGERGRVLLHAVDEREDVSQRAAGERALQLPHEEVGRVGAMREAGFPMKLVDYAPCYRSPAGTGNAMAFMYWQ